MKSNNRGGVILDVFIILIILIVVAAVLFPIFARPHPARKSICQSNLKECAIALHTYWNDYDSCLPSSAIVRHSKKWNKRDFLTFATKHGKITPSANDRNTWSEIMYDHIREKDAMFCHADDTSRDNPRASVSYWWKLAIDKAWYGEGCAKPCRREADFGYNSDQVILYEHCGWHFDQTDGLKNGVLINVAFLDTHVKAIIIKNATSGNPKNCAANSDGEPMYFNYDNNKDHQISGNTPAKFIDPNRYSDSY